MTDTVSIAARTGLPRSVIRRTHVVPLPPASLDRPPGATLLVHLVVPGAPVPKARPRVTHTHTYTPRRTQEAEERLLAYLKVRYPRQRLCVQPVSVSVECWFKGQPRIDVDNLLKLPLDAFNGIVWVDDAQVIEAHIRKHLHSAVPRTEIWVWQLEGQA